MAPFHVATLTVKRELPRVSTLPLYWSETMAPFHVRFLFCLQIPEEVYVAKSIGSLNIEELIILSDNNTPVSI